MRSRPTYRLMPASAAFLIVSSVLLAAGPQQVARKMVEKMPAPDPQAGRELAARVMEAGSPAIREVCKMLTPPGVGDDSKARYAVQQLSVYAGRPGAEKDRAAYTKALVGALKAASNKEVKAFLVQQLEFVARDDAVDALGDLLADERLCPTAVQTLATIGSDRAIDELKQALPDASGDNLVAIIKALGELRCKEATGKILQYTFSEDTRLRRTALWAVANIGPAPANQVAVQRALSSAARVREAYEKAKGTSFYLLYARRLAEAGNKQQCARMCRNLIRRRTGVGEVNVRCAALGTLVDALGTDALKDLTAAVRSDSEESRAAALQFAEELPGTDVTRPMVQEMKRSHAALRADILEMLGRRGDESALQAVLNALDDENQAVRLAAVNAAVKLGGGDAAPALLEALQGAGGDEAKTIQNALMRLPSDAVVDAAADALPDAEPGVQVALIELLADRMATERKQAVFGQTDSDSEQVRVAAVKALGDVAEAEDLPRLLDLLAGAADGAGQSAARQAVMSVADRVDDPQKLSQHALDALEGATPGQKTRLLQVFPALGGEEALLAAAAHTKSSDADVRTAAIRALGQWSDVEAALSLLNVAHAAEEAKHRLLAVRGAIQVAGRCGASEDRKVDVYRSILLAAGRPQERRMALSGLSAIRSVEALGLAVEQLQDDSVRREAAQAAVRIACPRDNNDHGLVGPGVAPYLRKVANATDSPDLREKARQHVNTVAKAIRNRKKAEALYDDDLTALFNGRDLTGWTGATGGYEVQDGKLVCTPEGGGTLLTESQFSDFALRFQFKLTPGANNGLAIRSPLRGNPAYQGMELQILDNTADKYRNLRPYQFHGSIYGVVPAEKGHLKPVGQWNTQEVIAIGPWITVNLNGETILNANIDEAAAPKTMDGRDHPGLKRMMGHIGFFSHGSRVEFRNIRLKDLSGAAPPGRPEEKALNEPPEGFNALFNGRDLTGWKGLVGNPISRAKMKPLELARAQKKANQDMRTHWQVKNGALVFDGKGHSLCTIRKYRNFEMLVDWKIQRGGDSGIYLRGSPQVQIWDPKDHPEGSGGLYNNQKHARKPLTCADNPVGQWNTFRIKMVDDRVTVHLNGELVVDDVVMENYWDRDRPIFPRGQIELQSHGSTLWFRNVFLRELPENPGE